MKLYQQDHKQLKTYARYIDTEASSRINIMHMHHPDNPVVVSTIWAHDRLVEPRSGNRILTKALASIIAAYKRRYKCDVAYMWIRKYSYSKNMTYYYVVWNISDNEHVTWLIDRVHKAWSKLLLTSNDEDVVTSVTTHPVKSIQVEHQDLMKLIDPYNDVYLRRGSVKDIYGQLMICPKYI